MTNTATRTDHIRESFDQLSSKYQELQTQLDLDAATREFGSAVDAAGHDLAAANADHIDAYRDAFLAQFAARTHRLEHLSLQADLAHMDLRNEIATLHDRYLQARRSGRNALFHTERTGTEAWKQIRDRVQYELDAIGVDYESLWSRIDAR